MCVLVKSFRHKYKLFISEVSVTVFVMHAVFVQLDKVLLCIMGLEVSLPFTAEFSRHPVRSSSRLDNQFIEGQLSASGSLNLAQSLY
jgi:hypothetical protein